MKEYDVFEAMAEGARSPEGYSCIPLHWVFDVKHDFRHRARIVAGGHVAPIPDESSSSSVVSLKGVRILLFFSQLFKLNLACVYNGNTYFEAETTEKVFAMAGPEFEELEGRVLKITKALYGLKSSDARWHDVLADALRDLGWKPCKMEPDFWYRENEYGYKFICIWVAHILIASKRNKVIHDDLKRLFKVKGGECLSYYLSADLEFVEDPTSGEMVLGLSCCTYLKNVIPRVEEKLRETSGEAKLARTRVLTPMMEHYHLK